MDKLREAVPLWLREAREASACPVPSVGDQHGDQPPWFVWAAQFSTASPMSRETSELGKPGQSVTPVSGISSEHY